MKSGALFGGVLEKDDPLIVPYVSTLFMFFFSSRRRHTRFDCDWSSDVCSSDLDSSRRRASPKSRMAAPKTEGLGLVDLPPLKPSVPALRTIPRADDQLAAEWKQIGRASCRERV